MADTPPQDPKKETPLPPVDQLSVTRHRRTVGDREIAYTVTCGTLVLKEEIEKDGKHEGEKPRDCIHAVD